MNEPRSGAHWWRTRELEKARDAMIRAIKRVPKSIQHGDLPKFYAAEEAIDAYVAACVASVGFPDLVLVRGKRLVFAELKRQKGRLGETQADWIAALDAVETCDAYVWRPSNWNAGEIERVLA